MKISKRSLFLWALSMASLGIVLGGLLLWLALRDLPDIETLKDYKPPQSTIVFDRHGEIVGRYFDERRTVVPMNKISPYVAKAFIAAEDGYFYEHMGIDYLGLLRAIILEIKYKTIGGRRVGGSTITQQVARTMLLSSKQTYVRKLKEMILAKRIEQALSKEQILHLYLNQIYFGNGAYGIEEGALTYFQKSASDLTLFEAAALASIPKSPNVINPFGKIERLIERQHYVLDQMVKHSYITSKQAQEAKDVPLFSAVSGRKINQSAPYFLRAVKKEILPHLGDEFIRQGGVKVFSTLDLDLQNIAEESLRRGLRMIDKRYGYRGPIFRPDPEQDKYLANLLLNLKSNIKNKVWDLSSLGDENIKDDLKSAINSAKFFKPSNNLLLGVRVLSIDDKAGQAQVDLGNIKLNILLSDMQWTKPGGLTKISQILRRGDIVLVKINKSGDNFTAKLEQEPIINGGLVALDIDTGGVLAMVGGYDFAKSPYDRVTQAKRQVGSGIKPLIYALALDKNLATPATIITDMPKAFYDPGTEEFWRPRNHTGKYLGDITFRHCLVSSINTCTITLLEKIGIGKFLDFAKEVKLNNSESPYPRNLTIALGSAENHPIDVANAMRILPNLGQLSGYHMIDMIKYKNGEKAQIAQKNYKQVLEPQSAFIISNILQEVISPSKRAQYLPRVNSELAGKTGTTNDARSAWFFGYSPKILALVYVGYDDNRSIGANEWGSTAAFPIWADFMNQASDNFDYLSFTEPENIQWVNNIDTKEAFKLGTAPELIENNKPDNLDNSAFAP